MLTLIQRSGLNALALILAVVICTLPHTFANAKKLYKFQDENGRWHFTDKPPKDAVSVQTEQLNINQRERKINVVRRGPRDQPAFFIINQYRGAVEFELSLGNQENVLSQPPLPRRFVVPPASEMRAVVLGPKDNKRSWKYKMRYRAMLGDPAAAHRPPRPYRLPYSAGETYPITQAFHGAFSHTDEASEYAVDFSMPEGTRIHAARAGTVMDVANDFFRGGSKSDKLLSRANMIRIEHDDGTMAIYAHLRLESAQVIVGARVKEGQLIALSGNTGYSTGPHLHFAIQRNAGLKLVAVPFQFAGPSGEAVTPVAGLKLTGN